MNFDLIIQNTGLMLIIYIASAAFLVGGLITIGANYVSQKGRRQSW